MQHRGVQKWLKNASAAAWGLHDIHKNIELSHRADVARIGQNTVLLYIADQGSQIMDFALLQFFAPLFQQSDAFFL